MLRVWHRTPPNVVEHDGDRALGRRDWRSISREEARNCDVLVIGGHPERKVTRSTDHGFAFV